MHVAAGTHSIALRVASELSAVDVEAVDGAVAKRVVTQCRHHVHACI
jgi:hypothetical protein